MNEDVMYYFYYLTTTGELYAYADTKKISKMFEAQRNMDVFKKKKQLLTRQQIHDLCDSEYRDRFLTPSHMETYDKQKLKWVPVDMAITMIERTTINLLEQELLNSSLYVHTWFHPNIFLDKYKKCLDNLGYSAIHRILRSNDNYGMYEEFPYRVDPVNILIQQFGKTLKGGHIENDEEDLSGLFKD